MNIKADKHDEAGFFSVELFAKIKKYLWTAKRDDPPVIGTTENFCEPDPHQERPKIGMVKKAPAKKVTMESALSETHTPGHADLVNKLIEEESHDE